jgi:predicted nicotinamide N-methyase
VTANDIDPYAIAAVGMNARANGVRIGVRCENLLGAGGAGGKPEAGDDADVVLAGDVFYDRAMADQVMPFLRQALARGATVLVGDPGRSELPLDELELLATYPTVTAAAYADAEIGHVYVYRLV